MKFLSRAPRAQAVLRTLLLRRVNRWALCVCALVVLLALGADFLASDQPIFLAMRGRWYWFPNVFDAPPLRIYDPALLRQSLREGDFAILPLVPWGYNSHDLSQILVPPSAVHWLGTDGSGRDVLARIIHGSRVSLTVGGLSVAVLLTVGVSLGTLAGYFGRWLDMLLMRLVDVVHAVPTILLLVTMLAVWAPSGYGAVFAMTVVIGLVRWTDVARLVRGEILRVRTLDYVQAARAQGASDWHIVL